MIPFAMIVGHELSDDASTSQCTRPRRRTRAVSTRCGSISGLVGPVVRSIIESISGADLARNPRRFAAWERPGPGTPPGGWAHPRHVALLMLKSAKERGQHHTKRIRLDFTQTGSPRFETLRVRCQRVTISHVTKRVHAGSGAVDRCRLRRQADARDPDYHPGAITAATRSGRRI
jgi:hypothetical protein